MYASFGKFMKHIILAVLALNLVVLSGCVTGGLSMRTAKDPLSQIGKGSKVHIDALRDTEIVYRPMMGVAPQVATEVGLNVVDPGEADYVMFLNFRHGMAYNSARDQFEQVVTYKPSGMGEVKYRQSAGRAFGIINAGVFSLTDASRSHWEGSVEVRDIKDPEAVRVALTRLFERFGEDFRGEVLGR